MRTLEATYLAWLDLRAYGHHDPATVYLWTLPMFHCNGWCTPWGITAIGGTHVCLREVRGDAIWALIGEHRVTHLNGAPTVVTTIMNSAEARTLDYALVVNEPHGIWGGLNELERRRLLRRRAEEQAGVGGTASPAG